MPGRRTYLGLVSAGLAGMLAGCPGVTPDTDVTTTTTPVAEEAKLVPDAGDADDQFGWSVDLDGETALVGAWLGGGPGGEEAGSAYVFRDGTDGWRQDARLVADEGRAGSLFGWSVALDGDTALVGARGGDYPEEGAGGAYVFQRAADGWTREAELPLEGVDPADRGVWAVALDGGTALVGMPGPNLAYVFRRRDATWVREAVIEGVERDVWADFGWSVALDGDTALVGARNAPAPNGDSTGAVHVFRRRDGRGWSRRTILRSADPDEYDEFGESVAIDGDTAVFGAPGDDEPHTNEGSAYAFSRDGGWTQRAKLLPGEEVPVGFDGGIALSGETALIGDVYAGTGTGAVYVFQGDADGWSRRAKLVPGNAEGPWFGQSIAVSDGTALVGAPYDDTSHGNRGGSAYVLDL